MRYKSEYYAQAAELLKTNKNAVNLPSDIFFDIARLFEEEQNNAEKIGKLLSKAYTVLAVEDEKVVGISSMDKDGNIGILVAHDGETFSKACRLILNSLYRRAAQKDLPYLFVLPSDVENKIFEKFGYLPFENGVCDKDADNKYMLAKKIELEETLGMPEESVKRLELDPTKKIAVEGKVSVFPAIFLGISCFFLVLLTAITLSASEPVSTYIVFYIVLGVLFGVALTVFIWYVIRGRQLKNKVLGMHVTNGVITSLSESAVGDEDSESVVHISYVFYDDNMQKRTAEFSHKYKHGPYFYEGQELVIAYSESESYILTNYTLANNSGAIAADSSQTTIEPISKASDRPDESTLLKYVPINAVKMYKVIALSLLLMFAILISVFVIFSAVVANQTLISFWREMLSFVPMLAFGFAVLGIPGLIFLIIPLRAKSKYHKLLSQSRACVADGKLHCTEKTYRADNKPRFYCEYRDGTKKKTVRVWRLFASGMVKTGNTSVKVLFDNSTAIVLVRKDRYPNKIGNALF